MSTAASAELYLQLSRLEEAGLPHPQAFTLIDTSDRQINSRIRQVHTDLSAGLTIAEACARSGLFGVRDQALIAAGENAGKLAAVYRRLAVDYGEKAGRLKKIRAKLPLPFFLLLLAMLLQPLPALVQQLIGAADYVLASIGRFLLVVCGLIILFRLPFWLCEGFLSFLRLGNLVYRLQRRLPFVSSWLIRRQCHEFFHSLGLLLEAGLPMANALEIAVDVINNPLLRNEFRPIIAATGKGYALSEVLANIGCIDRNAVRLLSTCEKSGKLVDTLFHYNRLEAENISLQDDLLAEWLPRIFYLCIVGWIAFSMIGAYQPVKIDF